MCTNIVTCIYAYCNTGVFHGFLVLALFYKDLRGMTIMYTMNTTCILKCSVVLKYRAVVHKQFEFTDFKCRYSFTKTYTNQLLSYINCCTSGSYTFCNAVKWSLRPLKNTCFIIAIGKRRLLWYFVSMFLLVHVFLHLYVIYSWYNAVAYKHIHTICVHIDVHMYMYFYFYRHFQIAVLNRSVLAHVYLCICTLTYIHMQIHVHVCLSGQLLCNIVFPVWSNTQSLCAISDLYNNCPF